MTETLLQTKLYIPPLRPNLVPRPRLFNRLNRGLHEDVKLILISAPAGFGKTSLITAWRYYVPDSNVPGSLCHNPSFGWLSVDKDDNDPYRFLRYLLASLQRIIPDFGETAENGLRMPQPPSSELVMTSIVNEIAMMAEAGKLMNCCYTLVIDDYHIIQSQAVHDIMQFFLEHLPLPLHLAICSRADLPWSLSRLRANDQITELRSTDLRFTLDETAEFLNRLMRLDLSAPDLTALEERTEGWVAGLQLAALSMQDLGRHERHEFVSAFTGSSRYVVDYLVDEVLAHRPEGTKEFLLQTSILERMNGSLCDAVLGLSQGDSPVSQSENTLEQLERANLFLVPLDDKRQWYRYHHLFADLLLLRLRQTYPDRLATLHRRASQWYASRAYWDEAIQHALAAGDKQEAARLIEQNALDTFVRSELARLMRWVDALPDDLVRTRPWICIYHAWALRLTGAQFADVKARLEDAEQALETSADCSAITADEVQHIKGHIAAISAYQALYSEQLNEVRELGNLAMSLLPADNFMRSSVALALGWAE